MGFDCSDPSDCSASQSAGRPPVMRMVSTMGSRGGGKRGEARQEHTQRQSWPVREEAAEAGEGGEGGGGAEAIAIEVGCKRGCWAISLRREKDGAKKAATSKQIVFAAVDRRA